MRSDMDHTVLHHAYLYSPAAEHRRPLAGTHFTVPRRVEGWVDLSIPLQLYPQVVTGGNASH